MFQLAAIPSSPRRRRRLSASIQFLCTLRFVFLSPVHSRPSSPHPPPLFGEVSPPRGCP